MEIKLYSSMCKNHKMVGEIFALQYFGHSGNLQKQIPQIDPKNTQKIDPITPKRPK